LTINPPTAAAQLAEAINAAREAEPLENHTPPLPISPELCARAQAWAVQIVAHGYLYHPGSVNSAWSATDRKDLTAATRIRCGLHSSGGGQALAEGTADAQSTVDQWLADDLHRAMILGVFERLGCGFGVMADGKPVWVAEFA
jgi:uncharacterized protein YkwD